MERHNAPTPLPDALTGSTPWLRIHTLGQFQIDWLYPQSGQVVPLPAKKLHGQNAGAALGLLKALLSCPDRFATRAWLNEQFWPTSRNRSAEERLNDVVSSLRAILRPEGNMEMFVHFVHGTNGRGAGFRLDAHPQLWCDAEAFEWYVNHAMLLDQRGQDSTACWERAFLLAERGQYLPEQVYEEWARQKRDYLTGLVRDCVHRWTALLRQMGLVDEAIMRLRAYWQKHPTDEDAVRVLLELLGERERFQEADECYAQTQAALAEDGHEPDERTNETIEAVRASKVQRTSTKETQARTKRDFLSQGIQEQDNVDPSVLFSQTVAQGILQEALKHFGVYDMNILRRTIVQQMLNATAVTLFSPIRGARVAGVQAITDPEAWERLSTTLKKPSESISLTALDQFEHLIGEAWTLSDLNEREAAEGILSSFLPRIIAISQQRTDPRIAHIASQGLRLQSVILHHRLYIADKVVVCQQSVEYARHADNANTLVAALLELAIAYKYGDQYDNWFKTMQEALYYTPSASPLLQSQAYFKCALAFAHYKRTREAELYTQMGFDAFPDHPDHDPGYALADANIYTLSRDAGRLYLEMGRVADAYQAFDLYQSSTPLIPERLRMEIVNAQGKVALLERDLEKYASFLKDGLASALAAGSKKRFDEAYKTFKKDMPVSWLDNHEIQDIVEQYQLNNV